MFVKLNLTGNKCHKAFEFKNLSSLFWIHPTFYVSLLKKFKGDNPTNSYPLPDLSKANQPLLTPLAILASRVTHVCGRIVKQILVQWSHSPLEDAT